MISYAKRVKGDLMGQGTHADPFRVSLSVSAFTDLFFSSGHQLLVEGRVVNTAEALQEVFAAHGSTEVFYRCPTRRRTPWRSPLDSVLGSQEDAVARARLAKSLGLKFNPEFGLFCHYGDAPRQPPPDFSEYPEVALPGPWETLTIDQMAEAVRRYGAVVAEAIAETGVEVSVWDIGNEVDTGVAGLAPRPQLNPPSDLVDSGVDWYRAPDAVDPEIGKMSVRDLAAMGMDNATEWLQQHVWPHAGRLLAAFAEGVRSVVPDARFGTHISGGSKSPAFAVAFFEAMEKAGYTPDTLGLSFYPSSHRRAPGDADAVEVFKQSVTAMVQRFDRPVFVSEYGYPAVGEGVWEGWEQSAPGYPLDDDGQYRLLRDLTAWGAANGMSGFRPWLPDAFVGVWGLSAIALFKAAEPTASTGVPRPALSAMADGLTRA